MSYNIIVDIKKILEYFAHVVSKLHDCSSTIDNIMTYNSIDGSECLRYSYVSECLRYSYVTTGNFLKCIQIYKIFNLLYKILCVNFF